MGYNAVDKIKVHMTKILQPSLWLITLIAGLPLYFFGVTVFVILVERLMLRKKPYSFLS